MKLSEFKNALDQHAEKNLTFSLPGGDSVPAHAHITEVGLTQKSFIDCGGKTRNVAFCSLQIWVADDLDHRLPAGKLSAIIDAASDILGTDDPELQVECQQNSISLFSVEEVTSDIQNLSFILANKQTACLAMEVCLPNGEEECCGSGSSCCE